MDTLPPQEGRQAWINVLGSFLAHFVILGNVYAFGLLLTTYADKYDAGRAQVSVIYQLNFALLMGGGLITGRLSDRYGARPLLVAGTCIYVAGFVIASFANTLWLSILSHGVLVGIGNACVYWPAVSIIPMWFDKRRALALGLAVLGSGIGNFVVGVVTDPLLNYGGLEFTLQMLALYSGVFLIGATLCLKRRLPLENGRSFCSGDSEVLKDRTFQLVIAGGILFQMGYSVPLAHLAAYCEDLGFSTSTAGLVVGSVGIGSAVGRVVLGLAADKLGRILCFKALTVGTAAAVLVWYWCTTLPTVIVFAVLFGFFSGGFIALVPAVMAAYYGVARLGGVMGFVSIALVPGSFLGPYYAGQIFDDRGSYDVAIFITAGILGLGAAIVQFLPPPPEHEPNSSSSAGGTNKIDNDAL